MPGTPFRRVVAVIVGLVLFASAAVIHADLIGLANRFFIDNGVLAVRPIAGGRVFHTPLAVDDLHDGLRRVAPAVMVAVAVVLAAGAFVAHRAVRRVARAWPRGGQGVVAAILAMGAAVAFAPVGDLGGALAICFALNAAGFVLLLTRGGTRWWSSSRFTTWSRWLTGDDIAPPFFVACMTAVVFVTTSVVALLVFRGVPHVVDGVSHLFQARILASGHLTLPSHPLREFFDLETVVNNGRWYSQYTPGHAVFLAIGDWAGVTWLVNPVLGALTVPALYALGRETVGRAPATVAILLLTVSPFFVLMSSEYYSHASTLLFLTLFLYQYARIVSTGTAWPALGAGVCLGLALLCRPLTALAVAAACAIHALVLITRRGGRALLPWFVLLAVVTLGFVGLLLLYNRGTTGAFLTFGYAHALGLGLGLADGIDWLRALNRVIALNGDLLGWPVPALLLPALAFLAVRPTHWEYLFAGIFLSLVTAYAPTGYPDREFGPRYLYEAIGPLLLLSARGLAALPGVVTRFMARAPSVDVVQRVVGAGVILGLLMACFFSWPTRIAFYGSQAWRWAYPHEAVAGIRAADLEDALVFVRGSRTWAALFLDNPMPIDDRARVIYALDLGDENRRLMAHYPGRRYFIADRTGIRPVAP